MKTAMQQLLDITYNSIYNAKLLKENGMNNPREIDILLNLYNVYRVIIERDMLEKEKQQMICFYEWMSQNDTISNEEKYFHYTNEDMLNEYLKSKL